jgi:diguanylate cyclase (GGDEF)-like protein/PAS domain S-box-containing protein
MERAPSSKELMRRRRRSLYVAAGVIIGAIIGADTLALTLFHQKTLDDAQTNLLRQSLTLSELVERTFQSVDLVLESVTEKIQPEVSDGDIGQLSDRDHHVFLKEKMSGLPQIDALGVLDAKGVRLNLSRDWPSATADLSQREYFKELSANPKRTSFISSPVEANAGGTWVVIIARPILANDGTLRGVVFAAIRLEYFEDLLRATSLGEGYAVTLMRQDGTLLARYPMAGLIGGKAPTPAVQALANSRSAFSRTISPFDHQPRIAAAYRLQDYPVAVITTQSDATVFAAWRTTAITTGGVALVLSAAVFLGAFLLARSWTQQERLDAARNEVVEADRSRLLAEAELNRQRDIAEQSARFNAAVENMSQGLCMFDSENRLVVCNRLYAQMYGLPVELLEAGTSHSEIVAYGVQAGILEDDCGEPAVERLLSAMQSFPPNERGRVINRYVDGRLVRVVREPMERGGWVATHEDITAQRQAEQELSETKQFLHSIIQNIPIAVVVKEAKTGKFLLTNPAFEAMIDVPQEKLIGKTVFDIYASDYAELISKVDSATLTGGSGVNYEEYEVETPARGMLIQATNRIVIRDSQGDAKFLITVIEDVTERRKSEQRIAFMAHHDALTGLANRATVTQKIDEAAARQRRWSTPFTVLLLDLDRFKHVNDTLGHSAGDALLREVAGRLKASLRETDVLARHGGDEFAIIQSGEVDQRPAAAKLAQRITQVIAEPFSIEGHEFSIGTSIGIALAPEQGTDPDALLKMADMALYRAKFEGRNGYRFFEPEMGAAAGERLALESDLRRALQQNEFELVYQPIVDAKTLKICAAEALLRWHHPTRGVIYPDKFIPLAEETGQIAQIGEWVLRTACADAVSWPADVKVAVNLSPVQFRKTNLPEVVVSALTRSGLKPQRLELEMTETALIESAAECLPAFQRFKSLGIAIALDDFGTGYSSLSQLTMFPFDRIKIDKSFTQNLTKRADCAAIISATLTLANSLNIATTAEGVETADQCRLLRLAGVSSLQGYLFKRPVPVAEIEFDRAFAEAKLANVA